MRASTGGDGSGLWAYGVPPPPGGARLPASALAPQPERISDRGEGVGYPTRMSSQSSATQRLSAPDRWARFKELILHVSRRCEAAERFGRVKLNKILFFLDFEAYLHFRAPISGQHYVVQEHGPTPESVRKACEELILAGDLIEVLRDAGGVTEFRPIARREPELSAFSGDEIALVDRVIDDNVNKTASALSDATHELAAWRAYPHMARIPFEAALHDPRELSWTEEDIASKLATGFEF